MSEFEFVPGGSVEEIASKYFDGNRQKVVEGILNLKLDLCIMSDEALVRETWGGAPYGNWARIDDVQGLQVFAFTGSEPIKVFFGTNFKREAFKIMPHDGVSPIEGFTLSLAKAYLSVDGLEKLLEWLKGNADQVILQRRFDFWDAASILEGWYRTEKT